MKCKNFLKGSCERHSRPKLLPMRLIFTLIAMSLLAACAGPKYTVDDGRKVNEALLSNIRAYGLGEKTLRPAIVRSAALHDPECDTQWELPFSVATSYDSSKEDRVAWVRGLSVDERLTVVGSSPDSGLQPGDKIEKIGAFSFQDTEKMLKLLEDQRDGGSTFDIWLSTNKNVKIKPFKVCRGYTRLAPPSSPQTQDYHWLHTVHPLEVVRANLSDDEALWMVLWAQGVSEEGGARMKTYHYATEIGSSAFSMFSIASGIKGATLAANAAATAAKSTATSIVSSAVGSQLIGYAAATVQKLSQQQVMDAMQRAAANRSSLSGVAWMASTIFEKADAWAYKNLEKLNANPMAGFSLHQKMIERNSTANSMIFDPERLEAIKKIAEKQGRGKELAAILQGIKPDVTQDVAPAPSAATRIVEHTSDTVQTNPLPLETPVVALTAQPSQSTKTPAAVSTAASIAVQATNLAASTSSIDQPSAPFTPDVSQSASSLAIAPIKATPPLAIKPIQPKAQLTEFSAEDAASLNTFSGTGKVVWANGDVFEGALVNGQRHGKGLFVWASGTRYEGDWINDKPMGQGSLRFASGNQYEGSVFNGVPHGKGFMRYASGDTFDGNFNTGEPEGAGVYTWKNGQQFEGNWKDGHPNGQGRMLFASGEVYVGNLVNGEPDGLGEFNFNNGDKYIGQWKAGKKHGQGIIIWKNGERWSGIFENDQQAVQDALLMKN